MIQVHFIVRSLGDTQRVADAVINTISLPGIIALSGDLGAGKTTFSQMLGQAFGVTEFLPSPTFTLINEYAVPGDKQFIHSDLYRLEDRHELNQLGLAEYFTQSDSLTVVEWADRFPDYFPHTTVWCQIELKGEDRIIKITSQNAQFWREWDGQRAV